MESRLRDPVDPDGEVVDVLLQSRRDGKAAIRFFKRLLKTFSSNGDVLRTIVTDKLRSYNVAHREVVPDNWGSNWGSSLTIYAVEAYIVRLDPLSVFGRPSACDGQVLFTAPLFLGITVSSIFA